MTRLKITIAWAGVILLGYLFGRLMMSTFPVSMNAVLILGLGFFSGLASTGVALVHRKLDDPPVKNMSSFGSARIERLYERRKNVFRFRWIFVVASGATSVIAGSLLKVDGLSPWLMTIGCLGYIAIVTTMALGLMLMVEYLLLARLAKDVPKALEEQRTRNELLRRLGHKKKPEQETQAGS